MDERVGRRVRKLVELLEETATRVHQLRDGEDPKKTIQTQL